MPEPIDSTAAAEAADLVSSSGTSDHPATATPILARQFNLSCTPQLEKPSVLKPRNRAVRVHTEAAERDHLPCRRSPRALACKPLTTNSGSQRCSQWPQARPRQGRRVR
jgi:hypothetical protein